MKRAAPNPPNSTTHGVVIRVARNAFAPVVADAMLECVV
jgi:hypothetical protein